MNQLVLKCLVSKQLLTWIVDHNNIMQGYPLDHSKGRHSSLTITKWQLIVEFIIGVHVNSGFKSFSCKCTFYLAWCYRNMHTILPVNL